MDTVKLICLDIALLVNFIGGIVNICIDPWYCAFMSIIKNKNSVSSNAREAPLKKGLIFASGLVFENGE